MKIAKFEQRSNEVGLCAMERCVRSFMMLSIRAFRARWVVPHIGLPEGRQRDLRGEG